jgi:hypothetical protein
VDVETGQQRVLARHRQVGFGQPNHDLVPLYSPHWDPGDFRDLQIINVETGKTQSVPVTADAVKKDHPDWVAKTFGDRPISIFFPVLSPDLQRVFFKMACATGSDFRSRDASERDGLLCYDLAAERFLFMQKTWGHPAWSPDSTQILNINGLVTDCDTGRTHLIPNVPKLPGSHPSFSPDRTLYTSDGVATAFDKPKGWWVVGVGDAKTGEFIVLDAFDNSKGAKSWRVSHPHPVFSPDGKRLYFNVNDGPRTRLFVAEASQ